MSSLRNVEMTAPYMHDGRFATLAAAVFHYVRGVRRSPTLDPNLAKHPPGGVRLPPEDLRALVAFDGGIPAARLAPGRAPASAMSATFHFARVGKRQTDRWPSCAWSVRCNLSRQTHGDSRLGSPPVAP